MKQILCFGDSNTWGLDGETGKRFPWEERWTGILQEKLADRDIRIVEEGLCGRTTIFEDPLRLGRRGTELLPTLLETHTPDDQEFSPESVEVSKKLEPVYEKVAGKYGKRFMRAADYANPSEADQEHMDGQSHKILADAIYRKLEAEIL